MDREIRKIKKETKHAAKDLGKLEKMDKKQDNKLMKCHMNMKKK